MESELRAWRALNWSTVILYSAQVAKTWFASAEERRGGAELDILVGEREEERGVDFGGFKECEFGTGSRPVPTSSLGRNDALSTLDFTYVKGKDFLVASFICNGWLQFLFVLERRAKGCDLELLLLPGHIKRSIGGNLLLILHC